jgi:hypothetical protein
VNRQRAERAVQDPRWSVKMAAEARARVPGRSGSRAQQERAARARKRAHACRVRVERDDERARDSMDGMKIDERLEVLEARIDRIETLLGALLAGLESATSGPEAPGRRGQGEEDDDGHDRAGAGGGGGAQEPRTGPVIPGTRIRCTGEVLERLRRVPVPFVRAMVARRVADAARAAGVGVVDVAFFERAATF